jgi:hypothetical protein
MLVNELSNFIRNHVHLKVPKSAFLIYQGASTMFLSIRRAQVKVGLINLCKGLFSLNVHEE